MTLFTRIIVFCTALLLIQQLSAQTDTLTSRPSHFRHFYFYWGYNRTWFAPSTLHFNGPNYDFTVYRVHAKDRPSPLDWVYVKPTTLSIPQYNWRFGYRFTRRFAVSAGWDHMKYVMNQGQTAIVSGVVKPEASAQYAGTYLNQPVVLTPDFLAFEHTNGFNLISLDAEWQWPLTPQKDLRRKGHAYWNTGAGGIWMVTKTDVRVFGDGLDNRFKLAGLALTAKTGPTIEWKKRWFLTLESRWGFVALPWVPIKNDAPENADHDVLFMEWLFAGGFRF